MRFTFDSSNDRLLASFFQTQNPTPNIKQSPTPQKQNAHRTREKQNVLRTCVALYHLWFSALIGHTRLVQCIAINAPTFILVQSIASTLTIEFQSGPFRVLTRAAATYKLHVQVHENIVQLH